MALVVVSRMPTMQSGVVGIQSRSILPVVTWDPDYVVAPGETLAEWFEDIGLPKRVARTYGITTEELDGILAGELEITSELAQKLCNMTHIGAPMWSALEHNYRVGLAAGKIRS